MKRILVVTAGVLLLITPVRAGEVGSTFGALSTARTIPSGDRLINVRVGVADITSVAGVFGFGFSRTGDARLKIGVIDDSGFKTSFSLGADAKWQLMSMGKNRADSGGPAGSAPFDLAVGPLLEWFKVDFENNPTFESQSVLQLGLAATGSFPVRLNKGGDLTPYGRLDARIEWVSMNAAAGAAPAGDQDDSQLALGLNLGVAWRPARSSVVLYGELQLDGNDGLFLGLDYLF